MVRSRPLARAIVVAAAAYGSLFSAGAMHGSEGDRFGSAAVSVVTPDNAPSLAPGSVVVRLGGGSLDGEAAGRFEAVTQSLGDQYHTLIVRLDSPGGGAGATRRIIQRLKELEQSGMRLRTMVHQGDTCASACILVFLAARERYAGNTSAWGFHGASAPGSNVPVAWATTRFVDELKMGGVAPEFIARLQQTVYLSEPGVYWLSGYEVSVVHKAGIVTHLIPAWQPEYAHHAPPLVALTPR